MTGFELLFVDTAPFIYALESEGQFSDIAMNSSNAVLKLA